MRLFGYCGVHGGLTNNFPSSPVALVRFGWDEPAVFDQNCSRVVGVFLFPGGAGSVHQDVYRANGRFTPSLQPIEEFLCGIFVRLFDRLRFRLREQECFSRRRHL